MPLLDTLALALSRPYGVPPDTIRFCTNSDLQALPARTASTLTPRNATTGALSATLEFAPACLGGSKSGAVTVVSFSPSTRRLRAPPWPWVAEVLPGVGRSVGWQRLISKRNTSSASCRGTEPLRACIPVPSNPPHFGLYIKIVTPVRTATCRCLAQGRKWPVTASTAMARPAMARVSSTIAALALVTPVSMVRTATKQRAQR